MIPSFLKGAPSTPHVHLFTYSEAFAQVEPGFRVHRFGILPGESGDKIAVFYRCNSLPPIERNWRQRTLEDSVAKALLQAFQTVSIPLNCKERCWTSLHYNRKLEVAHEGASIELWWDTTDGPVGDALLPLTEALAPIVQLLRVDIEEQRRQSGRDATP